MDNDDQILRHNALLLTARERELVALTNKHQRLLSWLTLSNSLPAFFDHRATLAEICARFVDRVIALIKLQRVQLLELLPLGTRVYGEETCTLAPVSESTRAWLSRERSGLMNEPHGPEQSSIAALVKLERLLWHRLELPDGTALLLLGGFDRERASSYPPLEQEDAVQFAHLGQHFEALLRNHLLVDALEREKLRLQRFNEELDLRVRERTEALVRANRDISEALDELRERDRRLHEDLSEARAFQQGILPRLPGTGPLEFAAVYRPLDLVGGDLYDIAARGPGQYRIFLADATGHGVQASLRTIVIKLEYERIKYRYADPHLLLAELNARLVESYAERELLCTACCLDIELREERATVHYANAAHPAIMIRSHGELVEARDAGVFLGLGLEVQFDTETFELAPGDVLFAYTDGLSEQRDPDGRFFDLKETLQRVLAVDRALPESLTALAGELDRFRGNAPVQDDTTMVAARLVGMRADLED